MPLHTQLVHSKTPPSANPPNPCLTWRPPCSPLTLQTATAVIAACTQDYFVSMLTADVNVTALERLSRCDYSTAPPPCLAEVVARVDDPEVAAASRAADPAATEGDLTCERRRWRGERMAGERGWERGGIWGCPAWLLGQGRLRYTSSTHFPPHHALQQLPLI